VALSGPAPPLDPADKSPCTPEVVPEPVPTILEGNTRATSYRMLAPLQGAISHPPLFRRSRKASTLRLPSFTPSGWGNRRVRISFLIVILILIVICPRTGSRVEIRREVDPMFKVVATHADVFFGPAL
jgi:hypothetical protein